ncbi:glucose 1-dehydrogenase [Aestuariimicrobium kwangyangense]|uniref:glucose 1-dehydrogenase n=1 Tax=Aestuariimicrobium kwangyangense TaxID=396389 RepID=UPI0003B58504|nr:glucose 1-dehydrogenase [Aestuariimicrobium kwangyangense]
MPDQPTTPDLPDPRTQYHSGEFPEQTHEWPGFDHKLDPKADHGESTYRGSGRLLGRKALITGADSGIGRAVAIAFAREGADVALNYVPSEQDDAEEVAALIEQTGRKAVLLPADISFEEPARGLVRDAVSALGGLDILVNNAGYQQSCEDLSELTSDQFDKTLRTNVYAMFWITQEALPHLSEGASIINTTSIQAYDPSPHLLDYATTKAAINNFTKGLAAQLAPKGIRVNAVAPGPIWTPLQVSGGQPPQAVPKFGQKTPLGRAGQPAELAPAYVYLASAESSYVVGSTLHVNGGETSP